MAPENKSFLKVTRDKDVSIIAFKEATLLDAYHIDEISRELYDLIDQAGHRYIVLDLSTIKMLSSQTLAVLLSMKQKLDALTGCMVICGIDPRLYRVFKITNLQEVFEFFTERQPAVEAILKKIEK